MRNLGLDHDLSLEQDVMNGADDNWGVLYYDVMILFDYPCGMNSYFWFSHFRFSIACLHLCALLLQWVALFCHPTVWSWPLGPRWPFPSNILRHGHHRFINNKFILCLSISTKLQIQDFTMACYRWPSFSRYLVESYLKICSRGTD